ACRGGGLSGRRRPPPGTERDRAARGPGGPRPGASRTRGPRPSVPARRSRRRSSRAGRSARIGTAGDPVKIPPFLPPSCDVALEHAAYIPSRAHRGKKVTEMTDDIERQLGPVEILVANAGGS